MTSLIVNTVFLHPLPYDRDEQKGYLGLVSGVQYRSISSSRYFLLSIRSIINQHSRLLFQCIKTNPSVFRVSQCSAAFDLVQFWVKTISRFRVPLKIHFIFSAHHQSALSIEHVSSLSLTLDILSHSSIRYVVDFTVKKLFSSRFRSIFVLLSFRFLPTVNLFISHP
jgi:hypothetical protein